LTRDRIDCSFVYIHGMNHTVRGKQTRLILLSYLLWSSTNFASQGPIPVI
jgi:hypothetical protein